MQTIFDAIKRAGGKPYIVGGYVRDEIAGYPSKDRDVEVYDLSAEQLIAVLGQFGRVDAVGKRFGVIKLTLPSGGGDYDFSLPRRENKEGQGRRGFIVEVDPTMTPAEAAKRRDYTMNSMLMTPEGTIIDDYGGRSDIENRILRHTSAAFAEDATRVLRGFQFAGRFNMVVADETADVCRALRSEYNTIATEMIWTEWYKWAAKSIKPSAGLHFLFRTGWIRLYPELAALIGLPQEPEWHPEGSVYIHTQHTCDAAAEIADISGFTEKQRVCAVMGALCHDMGKVSTTAVIDGRITSHGHDVAGVEPAESFMRSIGAPLDIIETVCELTLYHMRHTAGEHTKRSARRLVAAMKYADVHLLAAIFEADHSGRPPLPKGLPDSAMRLLDLMYQVVDEVKQIFQGRHLIELGYQPGPAFGPVLKAVYELQLDGEVLTVDQGIYHANAMIKRGICGADLVKRPVWPGWAEDDENGETQEN